MGLDGGLVGFGGGHSNCAEAKLQNRNYAHNFCFKLI